MRTYEHHEVHLGDTCICLLLDFEYVNVRQNKGSCQVQSRKINKKKRSNDQ